MPEPSDILRLAESSINDEQAWLVHDGAQIGDPFLLDWRIIGLKFEEGSFLRCQHPRGFRDLGHFLSMAGYTVEGYYLLLQIDQGRPSPPLRPLRPLRQAIGG